ncbi:phage head closure protein [Peribacillus simplex]|uniref:Phage head-tail adapter protein n=1 Tax=Peribacillus simplex TaxID=1478 RepID=A0A9W4PBN9_9BACI|nr:phage head closure protein [Peribacillus simplex]CAH0186032.1 hypothetical protein SRABI133_01546 [Peribacillus simplex]
MSYEEFPHEITFQAYTKVSDGGGGYTFEWTDYLATEAFVCSVSSKELYQAAQTKNPINHDVFFPFIEGIKPDMRVKYGENILTIHSKPLDQGGQGEILLLKCSL